jgi:hypothetical protein
MAKKYSQGETAMKKPLARGWIADQGFWGSKQLEC